MSLFLKRNTAQQFKKNKIVTDHITRTKSHVLDFISCDVSRLHQIRKFSKTHEKTLEKFKLTELDFQDVTFNI